MTDVLRKQKVGCIAFAPLAGGVLTGKYMCCIPADSRAGFDPRYLKPKDISDDKLSKVAALSEIARSRGQSMAQMALSWCLRDDVVTSALIGASRPEQVEENVVAARHTRFTPDELTRIDAIVGK